MTVGKKSVLMRKLLILILYSSNTDSSSHWLLHSSFKHLMSILPKVNPLKTEQMVLFHVWLPYSSFRLAEKGVACPKFSLDQGRMKGGSKQSALSQILDHVLMVTVNLAQASQFLGLPSSSKPLTEEATMMVHLSFPTKIPVQRRRKVTQNCCFV